MVVTTDGSFVTSQVIWDDRTVYLRDIIERKELPQIARVVKGQYMGLGVPTLPNPNLSQVVMLSSIGQRKYIAAQCVKFREKGKHNLVGPRLSIPETFDGYFEILSEDGQAVRCIETVVELFRRFPHSCLVRDNIKAFVNSKWLEEDPAIFSPDQTRTLYNGEVLTLIGEVTGPARTPKQEVARYLRCKDTRDENVFLPMELRGKFSAIAREDNISGVHSVKTLFSKRLPLMVRLVHGRPPVTSGIKNLLQHFYPEMRLFASTKEECILALPLNREGPLVILPPTLPMKLQLASNARILQLKQLSRIEEKSMLLYSQIKDRIQVLDGSYAKNLRNESSQWKFPPLLKRSSTDIHIIRHQSTPVTPLPTTPSIEEEGDCLKDYDDVDQIYDYVRGFAPLPRHIKSPYDWSDSHSAEIYQRQQSADFRQKPCPIRQSSEKARQRKDLEPPDPPPSSYLLTPDYELKRSAEKRTRRALDREPVRANDYSRQISTNACVSEDLGSNLSLSKMYVKSNNKRHGAHKLLRHKSHEVRENVYVSQPLLNGHLGTSPLFRIRYKSLTNLLQAVDSDTLNSSNSGGNGSKASGGLPEKRLRRLSRPRSLTDLVWDLKNQHVHQAPPVEVHEHEPVIADMPPRFSPAPAPALRSSSPNGKVKVKSTHSYLALLSPGSRSYDIKKKHKIVHSSSPKPGLAYI